MKLSLLSLGLASMLSMFACGSAARPIAPTTPNGSAAPRSPATPAPPSPPVASLPTSGSEGIRGTVTITSGDFMPPMPAGGTTAAPHAPVHVFAGTVPTSSKLDRTNSRYLGQVVTDANGNYQVALPPGRYTVVIEHAGEFYLNCYEGDGTRCSTEVVRGTWARSDIDDNAEATY